MNIVAVSRYALGCILLTGLTTPPPTGGTPAIAQIGAAAGQAVVRQSYSKFEDRIWAYMESQGYAIAQNPGEINIIYVEGANEDGTLNDNKSNEFNDRRIVLTVTDGRPKIIGNWLATVNPGVDYLGVNPKGLPHTVFGQYKSWQVGQHCGMSGGNCHEGLIQVAPIKVNRAWTGARPTQVEIDKGKTFDGKETFIESGEFGINQHWGYDYPANDISKASAGCLVGRSIDEHVEFMKIVKSSTQYKSNPGYIFYTTIIPAWALPK